MSYNGARYHGYQIQNNAESIQQTVENAIKTLIGEAITINGCSRTDTGVHAKAFVFNFKTENNIPCSGFIKGMKTTMGRKPIAVTTPDIDALLK